MPLLTYQEIFERIKYMELNETQLQSFIALYKKELNISLTPTEAQSKALSLLRFLAISVAPLEIIEKDDNIEMSDLS
jgi:hypothetical protein